MKSVRVSEEVHVNGDNVHVNIHVPTYSVPAHSKEINFKFGVEHTQSMPLGKCGKGTVTKESETKWTAKLTHDAGCSCTITREIRNGEMWITMEGQNSKTIRKFERCSQGAASECTSSKTGCSPFQGSWRLYGSDNFDHFLETAGKLPLTLPYVLLLLPFQYIYMYIVVACYRYHCNNPSFW